ncbi:DUF7342 family protein [Halarchaeum nitratireducens]|uniref:ArsR family transcriptional regulator n=1 Tax=Halarchaeum nitratireducens TaxID=489913 RepID=A0A830GES3_9EURY|nr:hypothetical protein [Halarchaeum nitratireducens]GGN25329.1 hypothetical protein GCM10009021_29120 [Halarchaeum nitratireducens]
MSEETPPDLDLTGEWETRLEARTVAERASEVGMALTAPTSVMEIAERAGCATAEVRPHLEWLVERGILEKATDDPVRFVRNEAYVEFRRITELMREFETPEAIADAIGEYRERECDLAASFEAASPDAVVLADVDSDDLGEAYDRLSEWRAITRRLRDLTEAKHRLESDCRSLSR